MFADLLSIAVLTALIMVSPGPDLVLVTRNTLVGGKTGGLWTCAGILMGNLVHISYCAVGLGWLIVNSLPAFTVLKLLGGAYLIYLGLQSFRSVGRDAAEHKQTRPEGRKWWAQGLVNNLLNPKGALFYLGIFAVYVQPGAAVESLATIVVTMMVISTLFWLIFVQTLQTTIIRAWFMNTGQYMTRWINRILGTVLVGLGLRLWFEAQPHG